MNGIYRIVFVRGQGFGWFTPEDWDVLPRRARERVLVLATVETEEEARRAFEALPQYWEDTSPGLHYQGGEWWKSTGTYTINPQGQEIELFMPLNHPLPVIPVVVEKLLPPPGRPKFLTD